LITHVLFDLDGTLTDPYPGITRSIRHALDGLGRPASRDDDLGWCIGPPLRQSFAILLETDDGALLDDALARYRERFGDVGMYENEVYDGVPEMLEKVRYAGLAMFVATSKPHVFAKPIVEHFRLDGFFQAVWGPELSGEHTEKAELLQSGLVTHGLDAGTAIMIGDRRHDVDGAKANGIRSLAVTYGYGNIAELQAAGPDHICETPADVTKTILRLSAGQTRK